MTYGLIGEKLGHSYSQTIHGFFGNPDYELKELPPGEVENFLRAAAFRGVNVTIPYKETVMPYCVLDETARKIGSVNTIVNRGGVLYGYNTDYYGISLLYDQAGTALNGKKIVILGSGGTSKTAACVARDRGARETVVISRGGKNNYYNIRRHADADVLVNTTPVGMFPGNGASPADMFPGAGASPAGLDIFPSLSAVIDVIYNPLRTKLRLDAAERGLPNAGGLPMLVAQAFKAHRLFFDWEMDGNEETERVRSAIAKAERHFSNIVLIGMPGCGKTTAGRRLAGKLARDFTDIDANIETQTGRRVPDIIRADGEAAFREIERAVTAAAAKKASQVIATGGGGVLLKENRERLRQNGIIFYLDRPLDKLDTHGRPLSVGMEKLYAGRAPLYRSCCHAVIDAAGGIEEVTESILQYINAWHGEYPHENINH